jgi:hypothetical protein
MTPEEYVKLWAEYRYRYQDIVDVETKGLKNFAEFCIAQGKKEAVLYYEDLLCSCAGKKEGNGWKHDPECYFVKEVTPKYFDKV